MRISAVHTASSDETRTTTRSCRDLETAISNFWSPGGVRRRPQRVPSTGRGGRRQKIRHGAYVRMCMQSLTTIGYEMKKLQQIANLITLTPTRTTTRTTLVALGDPSPGLKNGNTMSEHQFCFRKCVKIYTVLANITVQQLSLELGLQSFAMVICQEPFDFKLLSELVIRQNPIKLKNFVVKLQILTVCSYRTSYRSM